MKKVEIITLHRVTNFGSLLQTYALQSYVETLKFNVEVVNYVPIGLSFKRALWPHNGNHILKRLLKFLPNLIVNLYQYRMADNFISSYINVSNVRYKKYIDLEKNVPKADIYMTGSDQVWNTQNDNEDDDIKAYYLCFIPKDTPRIAYAGSFGRSVFSKEEKDRIRSWLLEYNAISVREDTGLMILEEMGIEGIHVVDPTFLLTKDEWLDFYKKKRNTLPKEGYVFVYNLNRNKLIEEIAQRIAKIYSLRIVNFADTFEFINGANNRIFNSPFDFLGYVANADYVVTDSFHGTSFSINMERQFITVAAPKYNSRIESVLRMMHCEERLVTSVEEAMKMCNQKIDYSRISCEVNRQRERSMKFLENALYECEHNR